MKKNALYENTAARGFILKRYWKIYARRQIKEYSSSGNLPGHVNQPQPATDAQFSRSQMIKRVYDRSIDSGFEELRARYESPFARGPCANGRGRHFRY